MKRQSLAHNVARVKSPQQRSQSPLQTLAPWMAILSLVLSIVCTLALFDDSEWDTETIQGLGLFSVIALILGIITINTKRPGYGMAIAGTVLSGVSLLIFVGLCVN